MGINHNQSNHSNLMVWEFNIYGKLPFPTNVFIKFTFRHWTIFTSTCGSPSMMLLNAYIGCLLFCQPGELLVCYCYVHGYCHSLTSPIIKRDYWVKFGHIIYMPALVIRNKMFQAHLRLNIQLFNSHEQSIVCPLHCLQLAAWQAVWAETQTWETSHGVQHLQGCNHPIWFP